MVEPEEIIEQPYGRDFGGLSAEPSTADALSLLTQTNPAELVASMEHLLAGEVWNEKDQKFEQKQTPFLNETGRNSIITIIKGIVNTNTIFSNLTEKEISKLIIDFGDEIILLLRMQYEEFGVDKANLMTMVGLCCRMSFLALKRCLNQGERGFVQPIIRSHESINLRHQPQEPQRKEGGFFNMFGK